MNAVNGAGDHADSLTRWNQLYDAWLVAREEAEQARKRMVQLHISHAHGVGSGPSLELLRSVQQLEVSVAERQSELDRFLESQYGHRLGDIAFTSGSEPIALTPAVTFR